MTARARLLAATIALATAVLTGCGLPLQETAEPVPGVPPRGSVSASPSADEHRVDLWLVSEGTLVRRPAAVPPPVTANGLITLLAEAPTEAGASARSLVLDPVTGGPLITVPEDTELANGHPVVTVRVTPSFSALPANEQVLLLGQVVLTLTDAGASGVLVTDPQGSPLSVPLPDGRLLDGPATRLDYQPLTTPRPTTAPS
jgi:hypothetical protein